MVYNLLEELGILEQTVIIFASDNGHEPSYYTEEGRCTGGRVTTDAYPWRDAGYQHRRVFS